MTCSTMIAGSSRATSGGCARPALPVRRQPEPRGDVAAAEMPTKMRRLNRSPAAWVGSCSAHCHVSPNLARGRAQVLERLFGSAPTGRRDSGPNIADSPLQKETRVNLNRRSFFAGSLTIAAASGVARAQSAVPGGTHRRRAAEPISTRRAFAALVGRPAQIRQLYEAVSFQPGVLGSIKNSFNGLQFGFGYCAEAIAIALAGPRSLSGVRIQRLHMAAIPDRRSSRRSRMSRTAGLWPMRICRHAQRTILQPIPTIVRACIRILRSRCSNDAVSSF